MNEGRRLLRNTVLVAFGLAVLYIGVNRLYTAMDRGNAPQWLERAAAFGLAPWTPARTR